MELARAFLQDGVFTLVAPSIDGDTDQESTMDSTGVTAMRTFLVTEEDGDGNAVSPSAFESLRVSEENDASNEMVVETVSEEKE